uniref:Uncharacterized protein n=1 Tax=Photinus pyralis TaxID=7054 RepID=A0A1Y1LM36_PHOPY
MFTTRPKQLKDGCNTACISLNIPRIAHNKTSFCVRRVHPSCRSEMVQFHATGSPKSNMLELCLPMAASTCPHEPSQLGQMPLSRPFHCSCLVAQSYKLSSCPLYVENVTDALAPTPPDVDNVQPPALPVLQSSLDLFDPLQSLF